MSGFQCWDTAGNLIVDTTSRLGRVMGVIAVSSDGSLSDAQLTTGTPFYMFSAVNYTVFVQPSVTFSGATMSWAAQGGNAYNGYILYGVF